MCVGGGGGGWRKKGEEEKAGGKPGCVGPKVKDKSYLNRTSNVSNIIKNTKCNQSTIFAFLLHFFFALG